MKAVYLNLDDALRAVLAGETPAQPQVPLAVTLPVGQSAAVFAQTGTAAKTADAGHSVASVSWTFSPSLGSAIAENVAPGLSQILSSESASVYAAAPGSLTAVAAINDGDGDTITTVVFEVRIRQTLPTGPVELVDFAPPVAGELTADAINTALGGTGAIAGKPLNGVNLGSARLNYNNGLMCEYEEGSDIVIKLSADIADPSTITAGLVNLGGSSN